MIICMIPVNPGVIGSSHPNLTDLKAVLDAVLPRYGACRYSFYHSWLWITLPAYRQEQREEETYLDQFADILDYQIEWKREEER